MKSIFRKSRVALSVLTVLSRTLLASAPLMALSVDSAHAQAPSFFAFESGHVRPMAMSADGSKLYVVNTPNNTLEIFNVTSGGLQFASRVTVGLEPVAVAIRNDGEVWVVNHLSDSVSIVNVTGTPRVTRTLLVGDEPRDIVFAGSPAKAFITTAHRGQQRQDPSIASVPGAGDPQIFEKSVPRADVWIFSADAPGNTFGGTPIRIMSFFADTPRALAVSPDKNTVYVAAFKSGNQTSTVNEQVICEGYEQSTPCTIKNVQYPGGSLLPKANNDGKPAPKVALMVKYDEKTNKWLDRVGRDWYKGVLFKLPDRDVFAVDANNLTEKKAYQHVGTTLFNMAVNPVSGALYVSNFESNNFEGRFEGFGKNGNPTLQGNIAKTRVTVIKGDSVLPRHLNKHIDYTKLTDNGSFDYSAKNHSLSMPLEIAVTKDGSKMYVTAYGSSKIGVYNTSDIENDTFQPRTASSNYITVSGGGPSGVVLDEARGRMYVTTRFDNSVKVIDLGSKAELSKAVLPNPEPANIIAGRPFLYDAQRSSANGENSCASCHIFGDEDALGWDLGNPEDSVTTSPIKGEFTDSTQFFGAKLIFGVKSKINGSDKPTDFHPLKGPMVTQSLRGLRNSGAQHWRGDRSVGLYGTAAYDSMTNFKNFGVAFKGLLGNPNDMSEADMTTFANFMLNVQYPPNPIRKLDNSLTPAQKRGFDFYFGDRPVDGFKISLFGVSIIPNHNCNGCHTIDAAQGKFGTSGNQSFEGITQIVKIAQLRNMYQKVGRYGGPATPFTGSQPSSGDVGEQIRGFGFVHDGTVDTLAHFFTVRVFNPTFNSGFPLVNPDATRRDVAEYMHAVDSDLAPIVGQQVTLSSANASSAGARIDLLIARAKTRFVSKELGGETKECELVAHVAEGGVRKGYLMDATSGNFIGKDGASRSDSALRGLANTSGQEVTYTCVVPGSGRRIAYNGEV
ncbi:MAG: hypothetical protein QM742_19770 [Aquabacterium sp.]